MHPVENHFDIIVIGAGAVGLSTAYKLTQQWPALKVLVLEKEPEPAMHQTGRNSGVIHSGLYYKPGSYRARLCVSGRKELVRFAQAYNVKHEVCGKVVVAVNEEELPRLDKIHATGLQNELVDIKKIDRKTLLELEPACAGIMALHVPYTGIIDYVGLSRKLVELVLETSPENKVSYNNAVKSISRQNGNYILTTTQNRFTSKYLISCGGLHSDRLAKLEGLKPKTRIVGFRGDYWDLTPEACRTRVRNLIYPTPNPAFPFLGVHFTRMVLGGVECGPSAVFSFKREGYGKTDFSLTDTADALGFSGTWHLFAKHWRFGLDEQIRAFSKRAFLKQVQQLIPSMTPSDLVPGRSGVRAMALNPDGTMADDFIFETTSHSVHVLNAPSPAATACLAIGGEICKIAKTQFGW